MKDYSKMTLNDLAKEYGKLSGKYVNKVVCHIGVESETKIYDKLLEVGNEIQKRMGPHTLKEFADALIAEKKSLIN